MKTQKLFKFQKFQPERSKLFFRIQNSLVKDAQKLF